MRTAPLVESDEDRCRNESADAEKGSGRPLSIPISISVQRSVNFEFSPSDFMPDEILSDEEQRMADYIDANFREYQYAKRSEADYAEFLIKMSNHLKGI